MDSSQIYIAKTDKVSLPWIQPRFDSIKKQKKPKIDGAVYPKEMVSMLLKLLVPWDILQNLTATTLPLRVYNTIRGKILEISLVLKALKTINLVTKSTFSMLQVT